jgi:DNA-binding NarL/FixJ family response regulator
VGQVVRLVLAHGHPAFAEGLGLILDAQDGLAVLGVAHDTRRAVQLAAEYQPDVLLLDAHLPGGDLVKMPAMVRAASPASRVLLLEAEARRSMLGAVIASGADGVVTRDVCGQQVVDAIRTAVMGRWVMVLGSQPPGLGRDASVGRLRLGTLSGREREVLGLLARAGRPGASPTTGRWRRARSGPMCRTCWSSSMCTASWRRLRSPGGTGWWSPTA